jgi:2-phosphosulfolactate phosphatase
MEILRADLATCSGLTGTVVVIDVLRSFTTAAYAFAAGARAIYPVENETAAWQLLDRLPGALTMGALGGGMPIHGFDLTNSPARLAGRDVRGRDIIQCTAGGARGLSSAATPTRCWPGAWCARRRRRACCADWRRRR